MRNNDKKRVLPVSLFIFFCLHSYQVDDVLLLLFFFFSFIDLLLPVSSTFLPTQSLFANWSRICFCSECCQNASLTRKKTWYLRTWLLAFSICHFFCQSFAVDRFHGREKTFWTDSLMWAWLEGRSPAERLECEVRTVTRVDYQWIHSSRLARDGWTACKLHASATGVFTTLSTALLTSPTLRATRQASVKGLLREDWDPTVYVWVSVCVFLCSQTHWSWSCSGRLRPHCSQSHSSNATCSGLQSEQHRPSIVFDTHTQTHTLLTHKQ